MRRTAGIPIGVTILLAAVGCGQQQTGAHLFVRLGQLQFDELRLGVTQPATGETVVDPATAGRYVGPFRPGDQDTIIYVADALDGSQLHCEATALLAGAPVASGAADMLVARGTIKDIEIVMGATGAPNPPPDPPPPAPTDGKRAMAAACSLDTECQTGHCVDGVCCESDCQADCKSCALPDSLGLCRPEPAGTVCQPGGCSGNGKDVMPSRSCDGAGKCEDGEKGMHCPEGTSCVAGACS